MQMRSTLRASDAEREEFAQRLRQAAVEGRITSAELETRLHRCWRAQTLGQLDALVMDLPGNVVARRGLTTAQAIAAGLLVLTAPAWFPLAMVAGLLLVVAAVAVGPHLWVLAEVLVAIMLATSFARGRVRRRRRLH